MRVAIMAPVQQDELVPLLVLGKALHAARHSVCILAGLDHASLVAQYDLQHAPLSDDVRPGPHLTQLENGQVRAQEFLKRFFDRHARSWAVQGAEACRGADVVMGIGLGCHAAASLAEAAHALYVEVLLTPRSLFLSPSELRRNAEFLWSVQARAINLQLRPILGLRPYSMCGPKSAEKTLEPLRLCGFAPFLVPRRRSLPSRTVPTCFWRGDSASEEPGPSTALGQFCKGDRPLIYVGVGKPATGRELRYLKVALDVAVRAGYRAVVVASAWAREQMAGAIDAAHVMFAESAPHVWLFGKIAAAIHQGGSAVVAETIAAGVPSIVLAASTPDEQFWSSCLVRMGIAVQAAKSERELDAEALRRALTAARAPAVASSSRLWSEVVRRSPGCEAAVAVLEGWVKSQAPSFGSPESSPTLPALSEGRG